MGYRWQNVDIEVREDGTVEVLVQGRGPVLPMSESTVLEPGDSVRIHSEFGFGENLSDQPRYEEYHGIDQSRRRERDDE